MSEIFKSHKLDNVCYDIRGPVLKQANQLEEEGYRILKLNIGNPAPFDLPAPDEIIHDVIYNLKDGEGYTHAQGLFSARKAIMQECQLLGIPNIDIEDIFLGNGVSELIVMAMQALLNNGDEILIPSPDYPLWTAAVSLAGGTPVHYDCLEEQNWEPDLADIESKISKKTRGLLLINPNNPTGSVYSQELLEQCVELARKHNLILFADEIYSKILYDDSEFTPLAKLAKDVPCISFNGLSKTYRLAGFRTGWLIISGDKDRISDYVQGINMLASMRLCANVPGQLAVQTALGGYQSIKDLICPGGRLYEQRELAWKMLNDIPGVSCTKPGGAIYMFPKLDPEVYPIKDDQQFVLDLLNKEKMLLVQGTAFNLKTADHLRLVFLPRVDVLEDAIGRLAKFLETIRK